MNIGVVGLSHHTASLEVRERFALDATATTRVLARALAAGPREAVVLSTCNRTELYWASQAEPQAQAAGLIGILAAEAAFPADAASEYCYLHTGGGAARHLFRVAASLDSLVVGEAQIQGQVRDAYRQAASAALEPKPVGPTLARLFEMALAVGGRVRSETALGTGAGSIPSAAVELARKVFGSLKGRRALIVGAGEMSELAGVCLREAGVSAIAVASRGEARAHGRG
ncbi:MAG: glutamyl-tRNA reductase, partial [Longimicrobiales bacterium]